MPDRSIDVLSDRLEQCANPNCAERFIPYRPAQKYHSRPCQRKHYRLLNPPSPEYNVWSAMIGRCHNRKHPYFAYYGGRGIKVCKRWRKSFLNFLADMKRRPTAKHTLERKENNLGYGPDNCKWATRDEQQKNLRSNRNLTYSGETHCIAEWARRTGIPDMVIRGRLKRGQQYT